MRPRVFQIPANLQVRGLRPGVTPPAMRNYPVQVRNRLGALGGGENMPGPNGAPGSPTYPYGEDLAFGEGGPNGTPSTVQSPPDIGTPPPALTPQQLSMISTPNGQSARDWINPTSYATVPINASAGGATPILQLNYKRNSLIIQNTSTATIAGDTAPTLYVGFNAQPQVLGSLALPPGLGFYWSASDCPPRDAIYVLFGPFVNAGGSVVISGCVVQGTYIPQG